MFKDVPYDQYMTEVTQKLSSGGVFLTVKGEKLNTMTIGWGLIGHMWGKPIFIVPVRKSRFTYGLIEKSSEFTVSIPFDGLKKELALCGSRSGRDMDKFKEFGLTPVDGKVINTPVIEQCNLHYECKIVYKQEMQPDYLDLEYDEKWYGNKDYHTLYFGEIVACYVKVQ
ncbi:MAG: hypothetical protein PWP27_466 [Clostridiales bacterium]|jgi:flavin reductase (DIM6/NTAB) family NADH-FMN oxidoreductase RutF|nr:flavin reductase domain protein FMN-binding protein [Clostridia bacterium]MDK2932656.1 hypothetical protein [Clostridiales bacterium]